MKNPEFRGGVSPTDLEPITFFVPETDPFTVEPARLWLEVGVRRFRSMGNPTLVHVGAYNEQVVLAPDPRGGEHRWLQVSLQVPLSSVAEVDLSYRVTVQR